MKVVVLLVMMEGVICTITFVRRQTGVLQSICWWGGFLAGLSQSDESIAHCCCCLGSMSKSEEEKKFRLIIDHQSVQSNINVE